MEEKAKLLDLVPLEGLSPALVQAVLPTYCWEGWERLGLCIFPLLTQPRDGQSCFLPWNAKWGCSLLWAAWVGGCPGVPLKSSEFK